MRTYDYDQYKMLEDEIIVKNYIIKELEKELTNCRDQLNQALRYGFERNQQNVRLLANIVEF